MKNTLRLTLIGKYFKMTKDLIKGEDYRKINPYWCNRLLEYEGKNISKSQFEALFNNNKYDTVIHFIKENYNFKNFDTTIITLGYPKNTDTDRIIEFENLGIAIGYGKPEWGAEQNKLYY